MMLAYKAWRESLVRFFLSAVTLGWFCSLFIIVRPMMREASARPFARFVEDSIYTGPVRNLFVIFAVVLGLGGLLQEASRGSAPFTLALPVTRRRLVAVRAAVGVGEVFALALVPTMAVLGVGPFLGGSYSVADAILYSTQWAAAGSVFFAVAFLCSIWLSGPYSALTASILAVSAYALLVTLSPLRHLTVLNVFDVMGRAHPHPARLAGTGLVSLAAFGAAVRITERQDF